MHPCVAAAKDILQESTVGYNQRLSYHFSVLRTVLLQEHATFLHQLSQAFEDDKQGEASDGLNVFHLDPLFSDELSALACPKPPRETQGLTDLGLESEHCELDVPSEHVVLAGDKAAPISHQLETVSMPFIGWNRQSDRLGEASCQSGLSKARQSSPDKSRGPAAAPIANVGTEVMKSDSTGVSGCGEGLAEAPVVILGLDTDHDGCVDTIVTGVDRNHDGIPDILQQVTPSSAPPARKESSDSAGKRLSAAGQRFLKQANVLKKGIAEDLHTCQKVSEHYLRSQSTGRGIRAFLRGHLRSDLWWKPGCCLIPADVYISLFMDIVVISNTVTLGVQSEYSDWPGWITVDTVYASLFVSEIAYKLYFHHVKLCEVEYELRSFMFDLALAALSIFDVVTSYIDSSGSGQNNYTWMRIARLVRIARILRLMHLDVFRDLLLMISGAVGGLRTLGWSIVMIAVPIYVFALFFTEMVGKHPNIEGDDVKNNFSSIGMSMFTGFRCLVAGDCSQPNGTPIFVHLVIEYGWSYGLLYALTSVCMSFGLFNVIVAIYVENTVDAAKSNELIQRQRRLEDQQRFAHKIVSLVHYLWSQHPEWHEGQIFTLQEALELEVTEETYRSASQLPELQHLLLELDVPKEDMSDLFEICDADDSGVVTVDELVAGIKKLRGDPRRSDIVYVMLRIEQVLNTLQRVAPPDETCAEKGVSSMMSVAEMLE